MIQYKELTDKEKDDYLTPIIDQLKKHFSGSIDYSSGVNDGAYALGKQLMSELSKVGYLHFPSNQPTDDRLKKVIDWCDLKIEENTVRDAPVYSEIRQSAYKEVKSFLQQLQP